MQPRPGWELWLDCNVSPVIAKWVQDETRFVVKSAYKLELYGLTDNEIYNLAKANPIKVILISKDTDLPNLIHRFGSPPKLIHLRIGNCFNRDLFNFLMSRIEEALKQLIDDNLSIVELR